MGRHKGEEVVCVNTTNRHYKSPILHEAIPGHYSQLVYSNASPSIIKTILNNGAMIEGSTVYAERMMLEEGYGNHNDKLWLIVL